MKECVNCGREVNRFRARRLCSKCFERCRTTGTLASWPRSNRGWSTADPSNADPVIVERVTTAATTGSPLPAEATVDDLLAAIHMLADRGWSTTAISRTFGVSGRTAKRLITTRPVGTR